MTAKWDEELERLSARELSDLIRIAEAKRLEKLEKAKTALLAEMEEKAAAFGLSLEAIISGASRKLNGPRGRKPTAGKVSVKYRGPNGEEWSGRGRPPLWLTALEREGRLRDQFRL